MYRVQGSGFRVQVSGFWVEGSEFRIQGSGFSVEGAVTNDIRDDPLGFRPLTYLLHIRTFLCTEYCRLTRNAEFRIEIDTALNLTKNVR